MYTYRLFFWEDSAESFANFYTDVKLIIRIFFSPFFFFYMLVFCPLGSRVAVIFVLYVAKYTNFSNKPWCLGVFWE